MIESLELMTTSEKRGRPSPETDGGGIKKSCGEAVMETENFPKRSCKSAVQYVQG